MEIEEILAKQINSMDGPVDVPAEVDNLLALISGAPGFKDWAVHVAAHEVVGMRIRKALAARRTAATHHTRRTLRRAALLGTQALAQAGKKAGKNSAQIKTELLDSQWCVDEQAGHWLPLRQMSAKDLLTVAGYRDKQAHVLLMQSAFLRTVAKKLRNDETVADRWAEDELAKVWMKLGARPAVA